MTKRRGGEVVTSFASRSIGLLLLLLLVTQPLSKDGGMEEDHGASEAGQEGKCPG